MKAYSEDLRLKIVQAYDAQRGSQRALAQQFGVSFAFVQNLLRRRRLTGRIAAKPHSGGRQATLTPSSVLEVRQFLVDHADATLAELCAQVRVSCGQSVSVPTMCRVLKDLDLPRKKSHFTPASETHHGSNKPALSSDRSYLPCPPHGSNLWMSQVSISL